MKKNLKFLGVIIILLFILGVGICLYLNHITKEAIPDYNEHIDIPGLSGSVDVYRDSYGIPHIFAQNEKDLYLVTGYLEAEERLWQMDLIRRVTQGRLSEIFGDKLVETDVLLRKLRIPENSKRILASIPDSIVKLLDYFSQGVNYYIKTHRDKLPVEFKILGYKPDLWKPEHSLNLVGYMAWNLELGYKMEILLNVLRGKISKEKFEELLPDFSLQKTFVYEDFPKIKQEDVDTALVAALDKLKEIAPEIFHGSNNWVVGPQKSVTGKPIFSNDMHLELRLPPIWTRIHQVVPGKLNVTGVVLPGEPFVVAGHNKRIAWGMTNVMLDGADFYVEKINPEDSTQYFFNGQWRKMTVRKEKIYVKGKKEPVVKTLYFTHRGPIFTENMGMKHPAVSMRWIGNEDTREIVALYRLNRARNWQEFRDAVRGFKSVSQNIAYADVDGNFGLQNTGRIPVRTAPGYLFLPGDTDKYDWKSFVPFDSLPYEYNPARGFVSSANNRTIDPKKFKFYISEWFELPYRINRIRQMLTAKEKLSKEDMRKMLYDHLSLQAVEIKPVLLKYLEKAKLNAVEKAAYETLKKWDNRYEIDSKGPVIFETFLMKFVKNIAEDEMGEKAFHEFNGSLLFSKYLLQRAFANEQSAWCDDVRTKDKKETFAEMTVKSFRDAVAAIQKKYGNPSEIAWGDVHHYTPVHPLQKVKILDKIFEFSRDVPAPGCSNTVNPFTYNFNEPFNSHFGASEKHIFDASGWDKSMSILPAGISGLNKSPHYDDQIKKYVEGELLPDYFNKESIIKKAKYHAVYQPEK